MRQQHSSDYNPKQECLPGLSQQTPFWQLDASLKLGASNGGKSLIR